MQWSFAAGLNGRILRCAASLLRSAVLLFSLLFAAAVANAQQLTLTIPDADQLGLAGSVFTFTGTITNNTGTALQTSDLFLDFGGFDPGFLTPHQLLGSLDLTIADGSTSGSLQLFDLALAPGAAPGSTFSSDVMVQDAIGNLSDPVTVTVAVVPEPGTLTLLCVSAMPLAWYVKRRRRRNC
jgi:hypothetical protein